ncbi:MAG: transcription termination/antitermination NusG family protein [Thermoguttaceae bacterium]|jgi:transcriptional antiterminator RfaH
MPILRQEPSLFPETLLDEAPWPDGDRYWLVAYTKPRQEKALSRELFRQQIPFYLPLVRKTIYRPRRKLYSHTPLFAGYVFLFASEAERTRTWTTNRVARLLQVADGSRLVGDLRQLRQLISSNAPLTVESRLAPGDRVRVRNGPFAGIEGTVLHRRGTTRLLVSINFLQRGASVEIDDFLLEPIN